MRFKQVMRAAVLLCGLAGAMMPERALAQCDSPAMLTDAELTQLRNRAEQVPFHRGLLWQVEKEGITSYVFGTMHLYSPRHSASMRRLRPLIGEVDQVLVEFNAADMAQLERRLTTDIALITIPEGPSRLDRLGPEAWDKLTDKLTPYQIPPFMAAKMQPWFLGFTMMTPPCAIADIQAKRPGIDRMIETAADHAGKPVVSLDELDHLLPLLAGDPLDQQVEDLRWSLMLDLPTSFGDAGLVDFYFSEDVQMIWENAQQQLAQLGATLPAEDSQRLSGYVEELMGDLIAGRNHYWMQRLPQALGAQPTLVAVGAMHLPGENGVLNLLQQQGFTVSAVSMSQP
jgi:uncharacterized protein YbaP (TraB family)